MNCRATTKYLIKEISDVKFGIQTGFPELYILLYEKPRFHSGMKNQLFINDLKYYLQSATKQLKEIQEPICRMPPKNGSQFRFSFFI